MGKGDRRERQARDIYEQAGYRVQPFYGRAYGETDGFGHFDLLALRPSTRPAFVQVKSNRAAGIEAAKVDLRPFFPFGRAACRWLVCHDREGWRLLDVRPDVYETLVDERDRDVQMGEGVVEYLNDG